MCARHVSISDFPSVMTGMSLALVVPNSGRHQLVWTQAHLVCPVISGVVTAPVGGHTCGYHIAGLLPQWELVQLTQHQL